MSSAVFWREHKTHLFSFVFLTLFVSVLFLLSSHGVMAADVAASKEGSTNIGEWAANKALWPFKAVLYVVFSALGFFLSAAISLFAWAIDPAYMQLINRPAVYQMWQFVRDFFNLFFILTLLYIAFTTIFQVSKDYKKALLNLVIMALLVNFSFPISRFLIDAGNVPMYYFANQITSITTPGAQLGSFLGASKIQNILINGNENDSYQDTSIDDMQFTQLFIAVVYVFIFMISILVMSVMFVIRLIALIILVIFSSVGFAGTVIPGMGKFASQWWDNFTKYVLYGPAAMLMLLIATRFTEATNADFERMRMTSTGISVPGTTGMIASMAMFAVPIIMLWFAIGLSSKMSIAGSTAVVGAGLTAIAWTRKKAVGGVVGGAKWAAYRNPVARGVGAGMKDRWESSTIGKLVKGPSKMEAIVKGAVGTGSARTELGKLHQQKVNTQLKENKEKQVNRSALLTSLNSGDVVERQAAALSLAENGEIRTTQDLTQALTALRTSVDKDGNNVYDQSGADWMLKVLDKAKDGATVGMTAEDYGKIVEGNDDVFYRKLADGKTFEKDPKTDEKVATSALEAFHSKLKKDGQIKVRVDYEIGKGGNKEKVYGDLIGKLNAEDFAKQGSVHAAIGKDADMTEYLKKRVGEDENFYQEALKKMKGTDREKLRTVMPEGKSQGSASVRDKMKQAKSENAR